MSHSPPTAATLIRNWPLSFKRATGLVEPMEFEIHVKKDVDPLSGMSMNLSTVDHWWQNSLVLRNQVWGTPEDFLKAMAGAWLPLIEKEHGVFVCASIKNSADDFWILKNDRIRYRHAVEFNEFTSGFQSRRKAYLTFSSFLNAEEKLLWSKKLSAVPLKEFEKLFAGQPGLLTIEVLDFNRRMAEIEIIR